MEGYHSGFVNPSDSRSEQEETNSNGQVVSPEENTAEKCSICLGSPTNDETSLDGCVHKYCFTCIVEWIKLRPICPMCKRIVRKIIHVKRDSDDQEITEEVTIETVRQWALRDRIEINSAQPLIRERTQLVRRIRHLLRIVRLHDNVFSERGRREMSGTIHRRNEYLQLIGRYQILLDNWERPRVQIVSDPAFRMLVYDLRLRRTALVTLGNQRMPRTSISPQFFRDHERYQRSRISEFVRREISAVVPDLHNTEQVVQRVYDLVMTHQIMSPQFSTLLRCECTAFAKHVEHFVELLFEFTISNQELALFDQNSEYVSRREYRRRLSNMNFVPLSNDMDEEEISMEDENYFPMNNRNGSRFTTDNRISPSYFHFMAAYTDALMSLQRFILILETTDETLSQADERVLVDTVDELVETYAQHRHRVQNRHGNSSQLENADRQNSVVMSDAGNEQSGNSEDRVPVARPADARQSRRRPYRLINVETLAEALTSNSVLSRNPEQRRRVLDSFLGSFDSMLAENYFIGTSVAPLPSVSSTSNAVIDSGELNTLDGDDDDNDSDDEDNEIMVVDSSLLTRENGHASNSGSDIGMDDIPRNQSDGGHENTNMC